MKSYSVSDWSVKLLSKKNKGVYEPEFRLILLIPTLLLEVGGYIGWVCPLDSGTCSLFDLLNIQIGDNAAKRRFLG